MRESHPNYLFKDTLYAEDRFRCEERCENSYICEVLCAIIFPASFLKINVNFVGVWFHANLRKMYIIPNFY